MLTRLNPLVVVRAHWRSLEVRTPSSTTPDKAARRILLFAPAAVGLGLLVTCTHLQNPGVLVSALALFSAGLLAAFAQLASIRGKYPRPLDDYDPDRLTRAMLDEAIAHVLTAALLSVTTAVLVVVGMNVGQPAGGPTGAPTGGTQLPLLFSVLVGTAGTYLFLIFVMTIRKLFGAYVVANEIDLTRSGR